MNLWKRSFICYLYIILVDSLHYEYSAEAFQWYVHHFQCLAVLGELAVRGWFSISVSQPVPPGQPSIHYGAHGTEKLLLNAQVKILNIELNLPI